MKKNKKTMIGLIVIWMASIILLVMYPKNDDIGRDAFAKNSSVTQTEDKVGAKVWLKEEIHGTDGIMYRYIIKTDCEKWDFESRYMSEQPLSWVNKSTSAVEVIAHKTQIRYDGTVYASSIYYEAPLLKGVASENIPIDKWKDDLMTKAYQSYISEPKQTVFRSVLKWIGIIIPILLIAWLIKIALDHLDTIGKENEAENCECENCQECQGCRYGKWGLKDILEPDGENSPDESKEDDSEKDGSKEDS